MSKAAGTIGPAIIVAAVVCGPGSILTSSKTGAQFGYSAVWVLVAACLLMVAMVALAMRIGLAYQHTPCRELANRLGRPVAATIGIMMFLIVSCFQSSNNIAVVASLETFGIEPGIWFSVVTLVTVNLIVVVFLYRSRELYRWVEASMKVLVLLMVAAFLVNALVARPSLVEIGKGLVPAIPPQSSWVLVALVGTTFSVAAAFYQAYLVREKGWTEADRQSGFIDAVTGIATLGGITLVIMVTSAAVFHSQDPIPALDSPQHVALQLKPLFGVWSQVVFGVGIFAGAISSFLVNALIGGHVMADGFGWGDKLNSRWTLHFTTAALLVGLTVASLSISTGMSREQLIVFAQALTVVGVPAVALALLYLGIQKRRQQKSRMPMVWLVLGGMGLAVTCLLATRTTLNIMEQLSQP